jgi:tetratricopeptide (TPR) repeat protein
MLLSGHVARPLWLTLVPCLLGPAFASGQDVEFERTFRKGTAALRGGQLEEAAGAFTRCTVLEPTFAEAWLNLGLVRFRQNRMDDAIPPLEKSVQLKPKIRGAHLFLGIARYRQDDFGAARDALEGELRSDASNPDALMWLGVVELAAGSTAEATASLEKAAQLRPKDIDILYHLGRAHMLLSKEVYERMYQVDRSSWRVHQVLAQSFAQADRLDDAVNEALQAIKLKPDEPGLHEQLAVIYETQNNMEAAEAEFKKELNIDPHNTSAMYSLAAVSIDRSQPAVAVELLTEVLRKAPQSIEARYQLARAEAQLGNNDAAARDFTAVVSDPKRVDAETLRQSYYQLATLYRRLHRPEESRAALDSFARLKQEADVAHNQKLEDKLKKAVHEEPKP